MTRLNLAIAALLLLASARQINAQSYTLGGEETWQNAKVRNRECKNGKYEKYREIG